MRVRFGIAAVGAAAAFAATAMAQEAGMGLTEAQKKRALEIEAATAPPAGLTARGTVLQGLPGLASTFAGQTAKRVRPLVAPVESASPQPAGAGPTATQRAVVVRYDYATGITTHTTVDLRTGKALDVREDVNYPTPLAKEEHDQAVAIARSAVPQFDAIIRGARPEELRIRHLSPLDNDATSARYGHRLVYVWIDRPTRSPRVLVDLSTNEIVPDHH